MFCNKVKVIPGVTAGTWPVLQIFFSSPCTTLPPGPVYSVSIPNFIINLFAALVVMKVWYYITIHSKKNLFIKDQG